MTSEYKDSSSNPKAERGCCNFFSMFNIFSSSGPSSSPQQDPATGAGAGPLHLNKSFSDDENDDEDFDQNLLTDKGPSSAQAKKNLVKAPRTSVSAEAYGAFNKKENFVPKQIKKTPQQTARIKEKLLQSFLFSGLESRDLETVILAMDEKAVKKGDLIIKQYDDGDHLYVVDAGTYTCSRRARKEDPEEKVVKEYSAGEAFGELALLYNAPRAATIVCSSESGILFVLDRETFNHIVKDAAAKKREKYEGFLSKIEILHSMSPYERITIADAVKSTVVKKNEFVFKQGDKGDCFYMIMEGEAVALKKTSKENHEEVVFEYKEGDYFGELALLNDEPRAASIQAKTELRLANLDKMSFKRLLGPVEELLKRNEERYKKFVVEPHK